MTGTSFILTSTANSQQGGLTAGKETMPTLYEVFGDGNDRKKPKGQSRSANRLPEDCPKNWRDYADC